MADRDSIGLIIPDPRLTADKLVATSTYTQAGPRPGIPVTTSTTSAALESSGTMATSEYLAVRTQASGFAAPALRAAGYVHRYATSGDWQGDDQPTVFRGYQWIERRSNGGTVLNNRPHLLTLQVGQYAGRVLCASHYATSTSTGPVVHRLTPGGAWSSATLITAVEANGCNKHPCLIELPSGRVLCYYWVELGTDQQAIKASYSDDGGTVWTEVATAVSPLISTNGSTGYVCGRLRAAYSGGVVLLFATLYDNADTDYVAWQLASDSDGYTFQVIELGDGAVVAEQGRAFTPYVADNGQFLVLHYNYTHTAFRVLKLDSPWQAYTAADLGGGPSPGAITVTLEVDELAYYRDVRGLHWCVMRCVSGDGYRMIPNYSRDGIMWYRPSGDEVDTGAWGFGNADIYLDEIAATDQRGTTVIVGGPQTAVEAYDTDSLLAIYCGGNTSVTMPSVQGIDWLQWGLRPTVNGTVGAGFVGCEDVQGQGWTRASAGAPVETYPTGGVSIVTTAGESRSYSYTGAASVVIVAVDRFELDVVANGALNVADIGFTRRIANGTADYEYQIRFTPTGFRVRDVNGSADLATITVDTTTGIRFHCVLSAALLAVYYHIGSSPTVASGDNPTSILWIEAYSGAITNDGATPNPAGLWQFGNITTGGGSAVWRWHAGTTLSDSALSSQYKFSGMEESNYSIPFATANPAGTEGNNPSALVGRRYHPTRPAPITGCAVRLVDGPTAGGDTWTISARYDYPIGRIHPVASPSPRSKWRSTTAVAESVIWQVPVDALTNTIISESQAIGVYLGAINFHRATLSGYDGSSYTTLLTIDAGTDLAGLRYLRGGDTVTVDPANASTAGARWIQRDELAGGTVKLDTGVWRRILRNSSGRWTADPGLWPVLHLAGVDNSEPTSGALEIYRPNVAAVVRGISARYQYLRIFLNSTSMTPVDYEGTAMGTEAGVVLVGPYLPLAPYSWGRSIEDQPDVELVTLESGVRASRVLAPPMRRVAVSWAEGEPTRPLYGAASPEVFTGALGAPADTPGLIAGLLREIDGPRTPVVLVAALGSGAAPHQGVADALIYGRIVSSAMREVIEGTELNGEVQRVGELVIEEER